MLVGMLGRCSSDFPQLSGLHHDSQNSLRVGLLVGGLEAQGVLPPASCGYVYLGKVFPLSAPLSTIGVPVNHAGIAGDSID